MTALAKTLVSISDPFLTRSEGESAWLTRSTSERRGVPGCDELMVCPSPARVVLTLLNDVALVEVRGDEVSRSTNELDAALMSLVVRLCSLEGGKEGVMNVDHLSLHDLAQLGAEDLHVACEDDEVDAVLVNELEDLLLLPLFGVLCVDGEVVEGDVVLGGEGSKRRVVGDDAGDIDGEGADRVAVEEVMDAVWQRRGGV